MTDLINRRPAGFDYDFRPASYFEDIDLKTTLLSSISGEQRRRDVEERLASGDFDPQVWGEWLTDSTLDPDTRSLLSSAHPGLMSGEYLPPMGAQDIEIARVVLASVTGDVISVRARRDHGSAGGIVYLVVDEYGTEYRLAQERSARPLPLANCEVKLSFFWATSLDVGGIKRKSLLLRKNSWRAQIGLRIR
jgi:hypothetical protein